MIVYADTSALASAFLADEGRGGDVLALLRAPTASVVTSEIARPELIGAIERAARAGRMPEPEAARAFAREGVWAPAGPVVVVETTSHDLDRASLLCADHALRALDAIHLAACERIAGAQREEVALLSFDREQTRVAGEEGIVLLG